MRKHKVLKRIRRKYKDKELDILMVGAGALANFIAIGLSNLNFLRITVIDKDKIEETNLNRQVLYFNSIGEQKAQILTKRLKQLNKNNIYKNKIIFIDENSKKMFSWVRRPDIIIDCVDNLKTISILNKFATLYNIPLLSGGTSPFSGQAVMYIPGETSCLNCHLDIDRLAEKVERERNGCTAAPEGSVITTNQIIGGIMAAELKRVLEGEKPLNGIIKYNSKTLPRVGVIPMKRVCACHKKENVSFIKESVEAIKGASDKMRGLFSKKVKA